MEIEVIIRYDGEPIYNMATDDFETGVMMLADAGLQWQISHGHAIALPGSSQVEENRISAEYWDKIEAQVEGIFPFVVHIPSGRPRKYASNAEKQAAYRKRKRDEPDS